MRCHEAGGEQGITMATTISTQGERAAFIAGARAAFDSAFVQLDDPGYLVMRSWIDHDLRDWTRGEPPECPELEAADDCDPIESPSGLACDVSRKVCRERIASRICWTAGSVFAVSIILRFAWLRRRLDHCYSRPFTKAAARQAQIRTGQVEAGNSEPRMVALGLAQKRAGAAADIKQPRPGGPAGPLQRSAQRHQRLAAHGGCTATEQHLDLIVVTLGRRLA